MRISFKYDNGAVYLLKEDGAGLENIRPAFSADMGRYPRAWEEYTEAGGPAITDPKPGQLPRTTTARKPTLMQKIRKALR